MSISVIKIASTSKASGSETTCYSTSVPSICDREARTESDDGVTRMFRSYVLEY